MNMFSGLTGRRFPTITVFNPWPQCPSPGRCTEERTCVNKCSKIEGIVLNTREEYEAFMKDRPDLR
jgi:hypothetical protein